ncbi:enoyl-CoA hydratase family protein [Skermania sp. ID1734]|uniref:enoyl-CoA hydratase family protein n=1 Tax=Skermania sp. ID1734 TaxID=2597516 RepID=UPI00117E72AA|nr:enoyl-CoA hydratase family protein [Skermania sp. ID1734]TSE00314.1 enoyl-CoA hydratase family protein [Skermania sp. ID1734]
MSTTEALVQYQVEQGIATITLDSPHNRNAISSRMLAELQQGFHDATEDTAVRAIVLTHTGNTFCAGADLSEAANSDPETAANERTRAVIGLLRGILELPKPVIAQIDGNVRAGGMGIVGACDIVVAGPSSTFALTEARVGVAPFMISLTVLPRLTSRAASRYYLTGEKFDAATAVELGFVTIAADDPAAEVARLCGELRKGSPQGLRESKRLVNAAMLEEFDRSATELADRSARFFGTEEAREGIIAFLQRRPPSWAQ